MSVQWPPVAGNDGQSRAAATQPFAGEAPIVTDSAPALAAVAYLQVCALTPTGITPYVDATHSRDQLVVAAVAAAIGEGCPFYAAGKFNHAALTWPAEYDTLAKRKALCVGSMIHVAGLLV
jgi:hypothetical protein